MRGLALLRLILEHVRQQFGHSSRIGILQSEHFDFRHMIRRLIEPCDQRRHQLHALFRSGNDQAVGPRIGRDTNVGQDSRPDHPFLFAVHRQELQDRTLGVTQFLRRPAAGTKLAAELARRRRWVQNTLDRLIDQLG